MTFVMEGSALLFAASSRLQPSEDVMVSCDGQRLRIKRLTTVAPDDKADVAVSSHGLSPHVFDDLLRRIHAPRPFEGRYLVVIGISPKDAWEITSV